MKRNLILFSLVLGIFSSCATMRQDEIKTLGSIIKPDILVKLDLNLEKNNIKILGNINETIEYSNISATERLFSKKEVIVKKRAYISNIINRDDAIAQLRNQNPSLFDTALSDLAGKILIIYPDIDYILFPKIQIEYSSEKGIIGTGSIIKYKMTLMGSAVQLLISNE